MKKQPKLDSTKPINFEMAPTLRVNSKQLRPYIDQLLEILGHPEALVTDESRISDFVDIELKEINKTVKLPFPIEKNDTLVAVALLLKNAA